MSPHQILYNYFGHTQFRPGQEEIINAILNKQNVLAVMPTGAGKSICYQIPALLQDNCSIVISPLISLMQDQVNSLNKNKECAAYLNSSLDYVSTQKVLQKLAENKINLLYLAPEKLKNYQLMEYLKEIKPEYIFVDEAHCISEWGHNFRPSYRSIYQFAIELGVKNVSAFTATATPEVRKDIIKQLNFKNPSEFVLGFERENISLSVEKTKNKKEKILELLRENKSSSIVYTSTRKDSEQLAQYLKNNKVKVEYYHAGLTTELRKLIQDDFSKNNIDVIVATNAFGMGIDKDDIGMVIHYNIPGSIENLYQEFGRAGRNGNEAKAVLFYKQKDRFLHEYFIKMNYPTPENIKIFYDAILDYHRIAVNSWPKEKIIIDAPLTKLLESKSIPQNQFISIINSLEKAGYIKESNNFQTRYSFKFLLTQDSLRGYIGKLKNEELKDFILALLQYYGAVPFSNHVNINFQEIKDLFESKVKITEYFIKLDMIGILEYKYPDSSVKFELIHERIPSKDLRLDVNDINYKLEFARSKIESVVEYCMTDVCRFKFILDYFGENTVEYKCNKCDNCLGNNIGSVEFEEYISEFIIRTLKEFIGGLTENRLIGILTGKSKSHVAKSVSTYKSCQHFSQQQIEKTIFKLISRRTLKSVNDKLFWDKFSDLEGEEKTIEDYGDYEDNLSLFNKLREERNIAAKKYSQNPDIICSDTLLKKIAEQKPKSPSEFLSVEGVTQRMFNKIGIEFLEIIKEHSKSVIPKSQMDIPKHIEQTYQLVNKGYSLGEISQLQKLPESILSMQIESIIKFNPGGDYKKLINADEFELIRSTILIVGEDLKTIKNELPNNISYAKIRVVKAIVSSQNSSS